MILKCVVTYCGLSRSPVASTHVSVKITTSKTIILVLSWGLALGVHALNVLLLINIPTYKEYYFILLDFLCYALIAGLETYTVCYLKSRRRAK